MSDVDPVELAQKLVRIPSVTPLDAGALDVLEAALTGIGFTCTRLEFTEPGADRVDNLYARFGAGTPHLAYAGHTDVVPTGDVAAWTRPPFAAEISNGTLWGRGAADMKGGIAAFVSAAAAAIAAGEVRGSLSMLITGDEEGPAINGTVKILRWMRENQHVIDHCIVGEPTSASRLGDMIKIGRRGSINCWLTSHGVQGHVAYPTKAANPIPALMKQLRSLAEVPLDNGFEGFQPSGLEITDIHVGNPAHNVIPAKAVARFNVRFNPTWTGASIEAALRQRLAASATSGVAWRLDCLVSGEAFLTKDEAFIRLISRCIEAETGLRPELSTSGGTSDARFIQAVAPVAEFGLVGATIHKIDECAAIADIVTLSRIYRRLIATYFNPGAAPA